MPLPRPTRATAVAAALGVVLVAGIAGTALTVDRLSCEDFTYQQDAQFVLDLGGVESARLDGSGDGVACDSLPVRPGPVGPAALMGVPKTAPPAGSASSTTPAGTR